MDRVTTVVMIAVGVAFVVAALLPGTTLGPALIRRGPRRPITRVGRVCLFAAGALVVAEAYRQGVLHREPPEIPVARWLHR